MTQSNQPDNNNISKPAFTANASKHTGVAFAAMAGVWLVVAVLGLLGTLYLTGAEQARDESQWHRQMQLSVYATEKQLAAWVAAQQKAISNLAENESLSLYLADITSNSVPIEESTAAPAEVDTQQVDEENSNIANEESLALATYLRNLLVAEARHNGFSVPQPEAIDANVEPVVGGGMAIFDNKGGMVSSTAGFPVSTELPVDIQQKLFEANASPLPAFMFQGQPYLIFTAPVRAVQMDEDAAPIGFVVGLRQLDASFTSILAPSAEAVASTEALVVQPSEDIIRYMSPLKNGVDATAIKVSKNDTTAALSYDVAHPGSVSQLHDYLGNSVFSVAQPITGTDLFVVYKVDTAVAMADTFRRKNSMLVGYLLAVALGSGLLFAFKRNMNALRAEEEAHYYRSLAEASEKNMIETSEAQKKYENTLSELIKSLVLMVDSRDPNAQGHSEAVAYIAHELAVELNLSKDEVRATTLAGRLMNVGKINTSEQILLEPSLSEAEKQNIRASMRRSTDILQDVPFDVPVVETLKQSQEHVDGSGPLGLKGDEILMSAKIIAVVNAFVAMTSKRSYRDALDNKEALANIRKLVGTAYHYKIYAALENYLVNSNGVDAINKIRKTKRIKQQSLA